MARYDAGTITAQVDANVRPYQRAMMGAVATTKAATRMMSGDANKASHSFDNLSKSAQAASQQIFNLSAVTMNLAIGGIASLVQPAAAAIDALSGGVVVLAKSLTDMQGVVVALPVGLSALAQGFGAVKFATSGLGDAVKAFAEGDNEKIREALKGTSEEAGDFAKALVDLKPEMDKVRDAAAEGLFPGLNRGLAEAVQNLPLLEQAMGDTARVMGNLAEQAGLLLGSEAFGDRFQTITRRNADLLGITGEAALDLADTFALLLVKAKPLTDYMGSLIDRMGTWARATAYASAETGELTAYFERARTSFEQWGQIIMSTSGLLRELFAGAQPYADQFRGWLETTTRQWQLWSRSAEGAESIAKFFDRIQGPLRDTASLFGRLVKVIWDFGNTDQAMQSFRGFAQALENELLPALLDLAAGVGPEMATNLALLAAAIARLLDVASFNPLLALVGAVSKLTIALTDLLDAVPVLTELAGALTAVYMTTRLFNLTALISKMGGLTQGFKAAMLAATGAAGANTAMAATGAAATVATAAQAGTTEALVMAGRTWATSATGLVVPANAAVATSANVAAASQGRLAAMLAGMNAGFARLGVLAKAGILAAVAYGVTEIAGALIDFNRYADGSISKAQAIRTHMEAWSKVDKPELDGLIALEHALGNVLRIFDGDWDDAWRASARVIAEVDEDMAAGIQQGGRQMKAALESYRSILEQAADLAEPKVIGGKGFAMVESEAEAYARTLDELKAKFPETAAAIEEFKATHYDMSDALMMSSRQAQDLYMAVNTLGDRYATAGEKATAFKDALYTLTGAIDSQLDRVIAGADAAREFRKKMDELKESNALANVVLRNGNVIINKHNKGSYEGAQAARTLRNNILDKVAATYEETRSTRAAMRKYQELRAELIKNHDEYGVSRKKAKELAKALLGVPNKVETALKVDPKGFIEALNKTGRVKKALQAVTREKGEAKVTVDGASEAKSVIGRIKDSVMGFVKGHYVASVTVTGMVDPANDQYRFVKANGKGTIPLGFIDGYATGGQVFGPGTGTSDSIPAWLSKGEFVINAEAVRKYGSEMFAALNAKKFADGGLAGGGVVVGGDTKLYHQTLKALFEKLLKGLKGESDARRKANQQLERILKSTTKSLEKNLQAMVRSLTQQAKAALQQAKAAYRQRVNEVKQGMQGFGAVTQTGGTEYLSGQGLLEEMRARSAAASNFASQYDQLKALGLNQDSLSQIVAAGPQEGAAIAAALLEGSKADVKARLAEINALEQAITKIGKRFGTTVAVDEGKRADIREAKQRLRAIQKTEVTVKEGAVQVNLNLAGVAKDDRESIRDAVDKAVSRAFREFIRELKASR